jgi:uncharacterized membrane protein YbhN (UPF0104 family)
MRNGLKTIAKNQSLIVHVIWVCLIVYAIASINVLILALSTYKDLPGAYLNPHTLLSFSVISFLMVVIIAGYHLSTLIRRRKRRSDKQKISRRKLLNARNRRPARFR